MPASVLILRLSAIGDVLHTLPALAHLRAALPHARIGWMVEDRAAPLLEEHPHLDDLFVVPRRAMATAARALRLGEAWESLRALVRGLRARRYGLALDFQGNAKSALAGLLSGARERLGFARGDCVEGSHLFTTRRLGPQPSAQHRVEKYLALARAASGREAPAEPVLPVDPCARARAAAWWSAGGPRPRILLAPGTSERRADKRWPAESYGALAALLRARLGGTMGVAYGPGEEALASAAGAAASPALLPFAPLDLRELVAVLAESDLVVAPDSAAMHAAALLGRPTVGLFGPTDPALFAPRGARCAVVRGAGATTDTIPPQAVADAALRILAP
ncbi:MAG: glycosyltransferase family 9 protein [Planctomycetales bacterium]|nr:glycosyltransferase family 9 protein [Planctomycetales bacterium]